MHVLGDRAGANAARAGEDDRARDQFGGENVADARRRRLHPSQPRERRHDVAIDERREGDVRVRQRAAAPRGPRRRRKVC